MRYYKLTDEDKELIKLTEEIIKKNYKKGKTLSFVVGASLIASSGEIYGGVNIESRGSPPTSICAEMGAVAQMVVSGERAIKTVVAVGGWKGAGVIQPCGACRHILSQFGNPFVIINEKNKVKLLDLYPMPWGL